MLFLAAFVVVLPFAWFFVLHPNEFMAPYTRVQAVGPWMVSEANFTGLESRDQETESADPAPPY